MLTEKQLANMEELSEMRAKKKVRAVSDRRRGSLVGLGVRRRSSVAMESVVEQLVMESQRNPGLKGLVEQVMPEQRKPAALEAVVGKVLEANPYKITVRGNIQFVY